MFGAPFSNLKEHPKLAERASEAFSLLKGARRATQENADENELMMEACSHGQQFMVTTQSPTLTYSPYLASKTLNGKTKPFSTL